MIEARELCRHYRSKAGPGKYEVVNALNGLDLTVEDGEFLVIVGPSGCGKSTFLRMLAGFDRPDSGTLTFNGNSIEGPSADRSMIFQEYALFPWHTVAANIAFGLKFKKLDSAEVDALVAKYIDIVQLNGFENKMPPQLSGGMRQRVAVARAFAIDPEVLLMDEPFAALDAQTRTFLQDELTRIWEGQRKTAVFITHSVEEALRLADRVVVMTARPGRVKEIVHVDLDRPRDPSSAEYRRLEKDISTLLRDEVVAARRTMERPV